MFIFGSCKAFSRRDLNDSKYKIEEELKSTSGP